jgi:hypothetical protein
MQYICFCTSKGRKIIPDQVKWDGMAGSGVEQKEWRRRQVYVNLDTKSGGKKTPRPVQFAQWLNSGWRRIIPCTRGLCSPCEWLLWFERDFLRRKVRIKSAYIFCFQSEVMCLSHTVNFVGHSKSNADNLVWKGHLSSEQWMISLLSIKNQVLNRSVTYLSCMWLVENSIGTSCWEEFGKAYRYQVCRARNRIPNQGWAQYSRSDHDSMVWICVCECVCVCAWV